MKQHATISNVTSAHTDDHSWYPHKNSLGHNDTKLYLGQWLSDTAVYRDTLELVAERSRRFWWSQQVDLATSAWGILVAVEGRRRGIRNLPAFLTLAHLVNLAYAQNLFYLALLVTPSPLPTNHEDLVLPSNPLPGWSRVRSRLFVSKPNSWHPRPFIFYCSIALSFGSVFFLPYAAETSSFGSVAFLARASTFIPVLAPYLVPTSWGRVYTTPHDAFKSLNGMFQALSVLSIALHGKASSVALADNAPDSHYHRHSAFLPWDVEERGKWERGTTAVGKILGSLNDHPAVQAVGFDALLSTFSLGIWAAIRAVDVSNILGSALPGFFSLKNATIDKSAKMLESNTASTSGAGEAHIPGTPRPRRGRPPKAATGAAQREANDTGADAYEPTPAEKAALQEGDVLPAEELDWEAGSLAWGLAALLGLGTASSGVFGAECTAR